MPGKSRLLVSIGNAVYYVYIVGLRHLGGITLSSARIDLIGVCLCANSGALVQHDLIWT